SSSGAERQVADTRYFGRLLLRACSEWPCQRTAKQCDELASPHRPCLSARTTRYQIKQCCAAQQNLRANNRFGSLATDEVEAARSSMSASPRKRTNGKTPRHVRFVPEATLCSATKLQLIRSPRRRARAVSPAR